METKEQFVIYPLGKSRAVTIDPQRQFGIPCVNYRTPTRTIYGTFAAGDSLQSVAWWYNVTFEQALDAVQYETMMRTKHGRKEIKRLSEKEPISDVVAEPS